MLKTESLLTVNTTPVQLTLGVPLIHFDKTAPHHFAVVDSCPITLWHDLQGGLRHSDVIMTSRSDWSPRQAEMHRCQHD